LRNWIAVHTRPHLEKLALENLNRQGYETYLPLCKKTRSHARKVELISSPLFPRYLFVGLKIGIDSWTKIKSTKGVAGVVSFGTIPATISGRILEGIREREDSEGFVRFNNDQTFSTGDKVNIVDGFFAKNSGIIEKLAGGDRVLLLLDSMEKQFRINTTLECISRSG